LDYIAKLECGAVHAAAQSDNLNCSRSLMRTEACCRDTFIEGCDQSEVTTRRNETRRQTGSIGNVLAPQPLFENTAKSRSPTSQHIRRGFIFAVLVISLGIVEPLVGGSVGRAFNDYWFGGISSQWARHSY
jgi:hypothetical protein